MPLKVLTVDDSKTIRKIVTKAFQPYDCVVSEAENGVEGLALVSKDKPDLIVLDITMPVMNGVEMLEKLKKEPSLKDIPVIMLTAESGKDNVVQIIKMGVKDYMVKPFKGDQLIERVNKFIKLNPKADAAEAEDASAKYFASDGDIYILTFPDKIARQAILEIEGYLKMKIKEGMKKLILDLSQSQEVDMAAIKLLIFILQTCQDAKARVRIVGTAPLAEELKGYQETSGLPIDGSIDQAKGQF